MNFSGNTSTVTMDQIKEITPDLIDRLPKAFSINCHLHKDYSNELSLIELRELNDFFSELVDEYKFDIKCIERKKENRYKDTSSYSIEMYETESKQTLLEMFRNSKLSANLTDNFAEETMNASTTEHSNVKFALSNTTTVSSEDDRALAESLASSTRLNDDTQMNATSADFLVSVSDYTGVNASHLDLTTMKTAKPIPVSADSTWSDTPAHIKNFDYSFNNTTANGSIFAQPNNDDEVKCHDNTTWTETPKDMKNFDYNNEISMEETLLKTADHTMLSKVALNSFAESTHNDILRAAQFKSLELDTLKPIVKEDLEGSLNETDLDRDDELYSTANQESVVFDELNGLDTSEHKHMEKSSQLLLCLSESRTSEENDWLTFANCNIALLTSSQYFFIQFEDFDEQIEAIQPEIDECLDVFVLEESSLCVSQFLDDELFYRSRVLKWDEEAGLATVFFMDFGNIENVLIDTTTKLADKLTQIKPLAIPCKLAGVLDINSVGFKNFEKLVNDDVKLNVKLKKSDLEKYYANMVGLPQAILVQMKTADARNLDVNELTLAQSSLWTAEPTSCATEANKQVNNKEGDDGDDDNQKKDNYKDISINKNMTTTQTVANSDNKPAKSSGNQGGNFAVDREIEEFIKHEENELDTDKPFINLTNPEQFMYDPKNLESTIQSVIEDKSLNESQVLHELSNLKDKNLTVDEFHDQDSVWSVRNNDDESRLDQTNLDDKNLTVSRFHDESSKWLDKSVLAESMNQTLLHNNLNVSCFHDNDSKWTAKNETLNSTVKCLNESTHLNELNLTRIPDLTNELSISQNETKIDNKNVTVGDFHDQDSNWTLNNSSLVENKDASRFHDQDSKWSVHDTSDNEKNLSVSKFHDESSKWSANDETACQELNETSYLSFLDNKNLSVSKFHDESSKWTVSDDTNQIPDLTNEIDQTLDINNLSASRFHDQDSRWTNEDTSIVQNNDQTLSYVSNTINEANVSVWDSDPNRSVFDMSKKKPDKIELVDEAVNRKLDLNEETERQVDAPAYLNVFYGFALNVNSLDNFYVQVDEADTQLMHMKTELDKCRKPYDKSTPQVGTLCVAPYHVDNQYYRAQITEVTKTNNSNNPNTSFNTSVIKLSETRMKVLYIDYGNEDYVDSAEIFRITTELKMKEPLAVNCQLNLNKKLLAWMDGLTAANRDAYNELMIKSFKSLTAQCKLKLNVINKCAAPNSTKLLVDVFVNDENICNSLMLSTLSSIKLNSLAEKITNIQHSKQPVDSTARIINYRPFFKSALAKNQFELNIQFANVLELVEELFDNLNDLKHLKLSNQVESHHAAALPECLVEAFKLKSKYGRVSPKNLCQIKIMSFE